MLLQGKLLSMSKTLDHSEDMIHSALRAVSSLDCIGLASKLYIEQYLSMIFLTKAKNFSN